MTSARHENAGDQRFIAAGHAQQAVQYQGVQINNFIGTGSTSFVPPPMIDGLPRDVPAFINQTAAIDLVCGDSRPEGAVYIVDGMPGVGKSSFAVHAGHLVAGDYPDGRLFLSLHSRDHHRNPVEPEAALNTLLRLIGVPSSDIPEGLDARAALWRAQMSPLRVLVIFDDIASTDQLEPLLTSSPGSLTIGTSRKRLARLDGIIPISLNPLEPHAAEELFNGALGGGRADQEPSPVRDVVRHTGGLPLAIKLVAARLRHRPVWSVADMAILLVEAQDRLDEMQAEGNSVATAFELAYRELDTDLRKAFRRLGLHPGPEFSVFAAAALFGSEVSTTRRTLEALYDRNMIDQPRFGRYLLHDLLYSYAQRISREDQEIAETSAATDRILDYYLTLASTSDGLINLLGRRQDEAEVRSPAVPPLASHSQAMELMELERANIHAAVQLALDTGRPLRAAQISRSFAYFLRLKGYWNEMLDLCGLAKNIFVSFSDSAGVADIDFYSGDIYRLTGRRELAQGRYRESIALYRALGDRHREARALHSIGDVVRSERNYSQARSYYHDALAIYRSTGNELAAARAMHSIADSNRMEGSSQREALSYYHQALDIYQREGDEVGEVRVLHGIADIDIASGAQSTTRADCSAILERYRSLGDRLGEADALASLGRAQAAAEDIPSALQSFEEALGIYRSLGDTQGAARKLHALARLHEEARNLDQAETFYREAAQSWLQINDLKMAAAEWVDASNVIFTRSGRIRAIEYLTLSQIDLPSEVDTEVIELIQEKISEFSRK